MEINECSLGTHNCQQQCVNENGGFRCECFDGYSLNADQRTCSGIPHHYNIVNTQYIFICAFVLDQQMLTNVEMIVMVVTRAATTQRVHLCAPVVMAMFYLTMRGLVLMLMSVQLELTVVSRPVLTRKDTIDVVVMLAMSLMMTYKLVLVKNLDHTNLTIKNLILIHNFSDVNECETESNVCDQLCENTIGSFQCGCNEGYSLIRDGKSCEDVNECTIDTHDCQQGCTNTVGRFECTCFTGYVLNNDQRTCAGKWLWHSQCTL